MTKKLLSSVLAIAMLSAVGSVCTISASAEEYDITGGEITFDIADGWKYDDAKYYIHIWDGRDGGKGLYEWQSKSELMTIADDGKTATYNVPEGNWNLMILSDSRGYMTYDAVFNQNCMGDTFTTKVDPTLAPVDRPRVGTEIVWYNNPDCGKHRRVSDLTNFQVEGHAHLPGETDQTIFDEFCEKYGPKEDGTFIWDEECKNLYAMTWEEAQLYVASQLDLTPEEDEATKLKSQFAEKYGVKRGLPVTPDMEIPERYSTDFYTSDREPAPSDWDGYYDVYYFEAPDNWVNEHKDKKLEGFDIGFYWYCGGICNTDYPGEPAKKLSVIDENGNDIYADRNIYYAFAPTFATAILWNNGIGDTVEENKQYKLFTYNINLDPMINSISDKNYEADETIDGAYISGCLFYEPEDIQITAFPTPYPRYVPKIAYFDPNTGETTTESLKDSDGNYVTIPDKILEYSKVAVNPYYDMDYTYVNQVEPPIEEVTEAPTEKVTQTATVAPTQAPTQKPTGATTATQATANNSNGTVATADNNVIKVLPIILILSMAGVVVSLKKKAL